jgi:hypothetical protein
VKSKDEKLFVGVDEYDSAANNHFFSTDPQRMHYDSMAGFFKTQFFAVMKRASGDVVSKYWLTGVLPVLNDYFSPLSATSSISRLPQYNGICGLTEDEVHTIAKHYLASTHSSDDLLAEVRDMKAWYGGYLFCPPGYVSSSSELYNPHSVFTHLRAARDRVGAQLRDQDNNIHSKSASVIKAISNKGDVTTSDLLLLLAGELRTDMATDFGRDEALQVGTSARVTWGLLYHFGVVTQSEESYRLRLPNRSMDKFVTSRLQPSLCVIF